MHVDTLLLQARERITPVSDTPALDAELLLGHVLGLGRGALRAAPGRSLEPAQADRFLALVERRAAGEPVAYLTGRRGFWTLDLRVGPAVLVPRPETELLVEAALERLRSRPAPAVLDLGTGSGAIALALAAELPGATVVAVDASAAALSVASGNAAAAGLARVEFLQGDWFGPVAGRRFDAIISNPPYLAATDPHLESLRHEPRAALVAGPTGLEALQHIVARAPGQLAPGGFLLLEHGWDQGPAVRESCLAAGLSGVRGLADLAGHQRATLAFEAASAAHAG